MLSGRDVLYIVLYSDRINVGFAGLQMNQAQLEFRMRPLDLPCIWL
jgi:hypothetical protein